MIENTFIQTTGNFSQSYERLFKSPVFAFNNGSNTIAIGSFFLFDFWQDNPITARYKNFNNWTFDNTSTAKLLLYPNQDQSQGIVVPAGQSKTISLGAIGGLTSLMVKNIDSTNSVSANTIYLSVWLDRADLESAVHKIHEKAYKEQTNQTKISALDLFANTIKKKISGGV